MTVLSHGVTHPVSSLCKSLLFLVTFYTFFKIPRDEPVGGPVNDWKMGGLKSPLNRAQSTLKLWYFLRLRGRPKKAEPQTCETEKR